LKVKCTMPPPRPPSRIEPLAIPVFAISWFADPANGRSITAYSGGGGSARTGVKNLIVIQDGIDAERTISTSDKVGIALQVYKNPTSNKLWLVVALGYDIHRYSVPEGEFDGSLSIDNKVSDDPKESSCAIAINGMTDKIAVGCDSGLVMIYPTSDNKFGSVPTPLVTCSGHTNSICAISFSLRGGKVLTSAKDGYARVWDVNDGANISEMLCNCDEGNTPPTPTNRSPPQILVRGCAFADMDGKVVLTVASARRGKAYLSQWLQEKDDESYKCAIRSECSPNPISAMCMSQDGRLLTLGSVNGSIILWSVLDWVLLKIFPEVHDLPVTCIAARPFDVDLQGENFTGVRIHAKSASADGQMGCLTLQRKAIKRQNVSRSTGGGLMHTIHRVLVTSLVAWLLSPIAKETVHKCRYVYDERRWGELMHCFVDDVLIAPSTRPGVSFIPY
jgi:WD40 repeat protein